MENNILDNDINNPSSGLPSEAARYLAETKSWTKFLSILGFIVIGIMVIGFIGVLAFMPKMGVGGAEFFTLIPLIGLLLLYFFPALYLYRFSSHAEKALSGNNPADWTAAFANLKSHYKFIGVLVIVLLSFYALALVIALVGFAFR